MSPCNCNVLLFFVILVIMPSNLSVLIMKDRPKYNIVDEII